MTLQSLKNNLVAIFLTAFLVGLFPLVSSAQGLISYSVSPTIFDMTANPGQTWDSSLRVINANPFDLTIYVDIVNFKPRSETGVPEFIPISDMPGERASTFAGWITTPTEIVVPAEQTASLPINIKVPDNAPPGGHYAALLIGTKPTTGDQPTSVATSQVISSLLFLRVSGDINELATVRSFRSVSAILERPETTLELRIENKGNVYVIPQGEIRIYNMWGQERGVIPVNQQTLSGYVYQNEVRKYNFDWKSDWSIADIGRYTAKATLSYGFSAKQSLTSTTSFWVIPWKWIFVVLTVIFIFIYGFITAIKMYVRRVLTLSGMNPYVPPGTAVPITKSKPLNIVAPLEAGMLDLRERLTRSDSLQERIMAIIGFIRQYWRFFLYLLGLILFVWTLAWYIAQGAAERNYTVVTEDGKVVTQDHEKNKQLKMNDLDKPVVQLVNRSGDPLAVANITNILSEAGFTVDETVGDAGVVERTVIVFSPSLTDEALKLSALLKNAPLSALAEEGESGPELTVFLGTDLVEIE